MGSGVVAVHISGFGQVWSNTHGIAYDTVGEPINFAGVQGIADTAPSNGYTAAGTDPSDGSYPETPDIMTAILAFHRLLLPSVCQLTGFTLSDGSTPGSETGPFWSQSFSIPGLRGFTQETTAPLSIAWLVGRTPSLVGTRTGHINLRASLLKSDIEPGARVGVQWLSEGIRQTRAGELQAAVDDSKLFHFFNSNTPGQVIQYVIPVYGKAAAANRGQVVGGHLVSNLVSLYPTSRQKPRGKKKA